MAFQAKRNPSIEGFTVGRKRQRGVLKADSDSDEEIEIDYSGIELPQEPLTVVDSTWKEWAGSVTKKMNMHAKVLQKLAQERAKRNYYRIYGEHCLKLRKYATSKALKTDFQTGIDLLWQERQDSPKSFWKEPNHKSLLDFIKSEYDMDQIHWENMIEFIQRRNSWADDIRVLNDDILASDLLKLEEDTVLRTRVPEIVSDIELHRVIINVQRKHPEIYTRRNEIWNKGGPL